MPEFSNKSLNKLETCDARLITLMEAVVRFQDCTILYGTRSEEQQNELYNKGNSKVQYPNSKHNSYPSLAVDVAPYPIPKDWGETEKKEWVKFYQFAAIVIYEARRLGLNLRWGGNWDGDNDYTDQTFDDLVHFELIEG